MSKKEKKRYRKTFEIKIDEAEKVSILGDFNKWDEKKSAMKKNGDGVWRKTFLLYPGTYEYKFMVDGAWVNDPENENECVNCFGSRNNIIDI